MSDTDPKIKLLYRARGQTYMMTSDQLDDFAKNQDFKEATFIDKISADAATFAADSDVRIGTILEIRIDVPDGGDLIKGMARTIQTRELEKDREYVLEVTLLNVNPEGQARIQAYQEEQPE